MEEARSLFRIFCNKDKDNQLYEIIFCHNPHWFGRVHVFNNEDDLSKFIERSTIRFKLNIFLGARITNSNIVVAFWDKIEANNRNLNEKGVEAAIEILTEMAKYYSTLTSEYKEKIHQDHLQKSRKLSWE